MKLIHCPNCKNKKGNSDVLGSLDEDGNLHIIRFHQGTTTIIGCNVLVRCARCGEIIDVSKEVATAYQMYISSTAGTPVLTNQEV